MSFLSFAFLFALPLAAAPILLHLFDRQRNVVIEWGAMQFLVEAARRRTNARRLQQWLLLLMRSLAIFCLVMALARPLLNSTWLVSMDRHDTILVIDNSLSMMRSNSGTSLFEAARTSALERLDKARPGDSVRVLLTSPYPIWMTPSSVKINSTGRAAIRDQVAALQPTQGRGDLLSALFTGVQAERIPGAKRRDIAVLTDGQAADWKIGEDREWKRLRDLFPSSQVPIDVEIVTISPARATIANLAVNKIHSNRTVVGSNQTFSLAAQVQNLGTTPTAAGSAQWTVAGQTQHATEIPALAPGAMHEVVWNSSLPELGVYAIALQLDADDDLIVDNRESVIMEVVDRVPVLVVESAPGAAELLQDSFFVQAALGWIDGEPTGGQGVFAPTLVTPQHLERSNFEDYRAIVIPNLTEVSEPVLRQLQSFANEGGGIWIALGSRTDAERFNQFFFADDDGLAPLAIERIVDSDPKAERTTIDPVIAAHPATTSLADSARLDTGKIGITRRFRFAAPPPGKDVSVLLNLTTGEPFAVEKTYGQGRIIVQAAPLKLQWTELVRSQAFVVMVQDWLNYLTQPQATRHNLSSGEPIRLQRTGTEVHEATLRTPQGEEIELTAESTGSGVAFRTSRTVEPGDYSLEIGLSGDKIPFHVHRDPEESQLTPLTDGELQRLQDLSNPSQKVTEGSSPSSTPSDPVWPILLMLLVGLMVAELLLSGKMARQRFGSDPIAETSERLADEQSDFEVGRHNQPRSLFNPRNDLTSSRTESRV